MALWVDCSPTGQAENGHNTVVSLTNLTIRLAGEIQALQAFPYKR